MSLSLDIRKSFGSFTLELALEADNETLGLLGASGCGKSLTLKCIAGLEQPDEGKIVVDGVTWYDSAAGISLSPQERKSAMLFQHHMLFPNLSVAANVAAGIDKDTPASESEALVSSLLSRFGLSGFEARYPSSLSGGQRQRVALARMLAASPPILMLDEPFSQLDSHLKAGLERDLLDIFDEFGGTVLYISHDMDEAFRFCDLIAVLDGGRMTEFSVPRHIIDKPSSLAALKLGGVANVSEARRIDEHTVKALEWGLDLNLDTCAEDLSYIGIRVSGIRLLDPYDEKISGTQTNVFRARIKRVSDSRFERSIHIIPEGCDTVLVFNAGKLRDKDTAEVKPGEYISVYIPSEGILMV